MSNTNYCFNLYQADISTNDFDRGFNTDLHIVREVIINSQDPNYN